MLPALPLEASSSALAALYETHGHLVLEDVPPASLLTLDGISLTISSNPSSAQETNVNADVRKKFRGFKLLPAGWHSLVVTPASDAGQEGGAPTLGAMEGLALRSVFFFHVDAKEIINRRWNGESGCLVPIPSSIGGSEPTSSDLLTPGLIAALDRDLVPYPLQATQYAEWASFARPLQEDAALTRTVAKRMLGHTLTADVLNPVSGGGLEDQQRGKRRRGRSDEERKLDEELLRAAKRTGHGQESLSGGMGSGSSQQKQQGGDAVKSIRLADFSLLLSWPEGALAAERTHWSRDKSWALQKALKRWKGLPSPDGDARQTEQNGPASLVESAEQARREFLLSFHLLFHLFVSLGSEDLLLAWRNHITLVCQSASAIGSYLDVFGAHPSEADTSVGEEERALLQTDLHARFLRMLKLQLSLLGREWLAEGAQEVEGAIKSDLKTLRGHMSRAMALDAREKGRCFDEGKQDKDGKQGSAADSEGEEAAVVIRSTMSSTKGRQKCSGVAACSSRSKTPRQTAGPQQAPQDFESLLAAWRSLSLFAASSLGWELDEQTDEEAEVVEELDAEHDEAVRRAMEELAEEEGRRAEIGPGSGKDDAEQGRDGDDAADDVEELTIHY